MTIQHHPDEATIFSHAAGSLNEGFSLLLTAHMEKCSRCNGLFEEAESLGGALLDQLSPLPMASDGLNSIWQRIETGAVSLTEQSAEPLKLSGLPTVLGHYLQDDLEELVWQSVGPGIQQHRLKSIGCGRGGIRLLNIAPDTRLPQHGHRGTEMTLVLRGAYQDELGHFGPGDLAELDDRVNHQPVTLGQEPCLCLVATEGRLRFSSALHRMASPFFHM